jgi:hypothetical protein
MLDAFLGLFCDQRIHDDMGSFRLHTQDLSILSMADNRIKAEDMPASSSSTIQGTDTCALESLVSKECCPCPMKEKLGR